VAKKLFRTYKVKMPEEYYDLCNELNRIAGRIYSKVVSHAHKIYRRKGIWLSRYAMQKYIRCWGSDIPVHSHSKRALVHRYYDALTSYINARKTDGRMQPPYKVKKYASFEWEADSIHLRDEELVLSFGRKREPLKLKVNLSKPIAIKKAVLVFDKHTDSYYLYLVIEVERREVATELKNTVSVDLGIIKPITFFDGRKVVVYHGGVLNALFRYRNKRLASLQHALSKVQQGSRKHRKLMAVWNRVVKKIRNQEMDYLHKITTHFITEVLRRQASVIVIGDVTNIRTRKVRNKVVSQKLRQWVYRRLIKMISYKAEQFGIKVVFVSEAYTSRTCPICGYTHKPVGRNFRCPDCGFTYHRDGVGAINIWKKYLGYGRVVADLAPAVGVRYHPHLRGHGYKVPWKPKITWQGQKYFPRV